MTSFGFANCAFQSDSELSVRFQRIGRYDRFNRLIEDFKEHFPDRYWIDDQWVIPIAQLTLLRQFCLRHGLRMHWKN